MCLVHNQFCKFINVIFFCPCFTKRRIKLASAVGSQSLHLMTFRDLKVKYIRIPLEV